LIKKLLIIGSGGHGRVVADVAEQSKIYKEISFLDNNFFKSNYPKVIDSKKVIGGISKDNIIKFSSVFSDIFIGIGDNKIRMEWLKIINDIGLNIPLIIDKSAQISNYAKLAKGTFVNTNVVIQSHAEIKYGSILNTSCTIDHNSIIGECSHISPGVNIAGNVQIGKICWIGIGSSIVHNIKIGDNTIIGAGSVVVENMPENIKAYGNPARIINSIV